MVGKIQTSIPQLDNLLGGGLEEETLTCLWVKPGVDGTTFAYQLADSASKKNKVFCLVNSKTPEATTHNLKEYNFK